MLDIDKLTVIYRDGNHALLALDSLSLRLAQGRVTALVGESGSGKTTLGKALMGLLPENAEIRGSIRLGDRELTGLDEEAYRSLRWMHMAMVFQNGAANLNPLHRIIDQVAEPLIHHRHMKKAEAARLAGETLLEMGLSGRSIGCYPHELSGGQAQQALFAMALILDPEVLILDEPTSALDAACKGFVGGMIRKLRNRGKAILLITHDLDLVGKTADEVAVVYLGQVQEILPAGDLSANPLHPYTLALVRSFPGMDCLRDLGGIRGDAFYRIVHSHGREAVFPPHGHVATADENRGSVHAPTAGCLFRPRCTQALDACRRTDVPLSASGRHQVRCLRGGIAELLRLEGIAKAYGSLTALAPTDLAIRAGETFCLVGETGSGKTTLAMIAAGALAQDRGKRVFAERDMDALMKDDYRSLAAKIGVIYQDPADSVSHRFTAYDIVAEPLRIQKGGLSSLVTIATPAGVDDDLHRRVLRAIADVHLPTEQEFLRRYPHELNMGTIQCLCIARALVHEPALIVADEPTSSLDPSVQAKVLKMLMSLQIEKGLTMIFVTHDLGLTRKISDRIGVMLSGCLVEVGPAFRVITRPGHPYTRFLIDSALGAVETGPPAAASAISHGCPFAERCNRLVDRCRSEMPGPVNLNGGLHMVRCFSPYERRAPDRKELSVRFQEWSISRL